MKFSEMPYHRPDAEALRAALETIEKRVKNAGSAAEQIEALADFEKQMKAFSTLGSLAYIRNTINTKDAFYEGVRRSG